MNLVKRLAGLAILAMLHPVAAQAASDAQKKLAFDAVDRNAAQLADIGDAIFYYGELGMQEVESTKLLKATLEAAGFKVELGGAGMPTNLWAEYGSGHPKIVIVTEIDALPGGSQTPGEFARKPLVDGAPGHMEGHNTHGGVASAAAFAVKQVIDRDHLPGTVAISFGPAEEELASRAFIVRAGYFKDADAAIYLHIGPRFTTNYGLSNYAAISSRFTFHGKTAHGAVNPWDGKDALDAVELMDVGFGLLRQQLHPSYRAHRTITNGGIQPNIIPDYAQTWWFVRDANMADAKATYDKLVNIAKGAALMTGTTYDELIDAAAWPQLGMRSIAEVIARNEALVGSPKWSEAEEKFARDFQASAGVKVMGLFTDPAPLGATPQSTASNDSGDVSWVVPAGLMAFPASVPGINYHEWHAAVTPTSSIAHKGMVAGAKALAASILDLMTSPQTLEAAKAEFDEKTKETPYFAVLPADAKPATDLNRETMLKYRPEMQKFYLAKAPRFQ
jgi:aminobenzoyl-glutamate utilization protein B